MTIQVIFGGQFGSEGKGLMASYFAKYSNVDVATTDCGPNAGHTAIWNDKKVVTYHLPMSGVLSPNALIYLNGGSIINVDKLNEEMIELNKQGFYVSHRTRIHHNAAVISVEDICEEEDTDGMMNAIASTKKGVGAAAARKVMRRAKTAKDVPMLQHMIDANFKLDINRQHIVVEVAQGYSLGVNAGFYPYSTHRACTPAQGLMNAEIPTNARHHITAVIRVNPIRVGNIPGGNSGACYPDQEETTWEKLGQEPQYTTVTNRVRRVFTYSHIQVHEMIRVCNPDEILINFAQTTSPAQLLEITSHINLSYDVLGYEKPSFIYGYGPKPNDILASPYGRKHEQFEGEF